MAVFSEQEEWDYVLSQLKGKNNGYKLRRKDDKRLRHSYFLVDGEVYRFSRGDYLGKGAYGKVKLATNSKGELFVAKISFPENSYKGMPFPESLWKRLGLVKDVDNKNAYEQLASLDNKLAVAATKRQDSPKQVMIMHHLGQPLPSYIKSNKHMVASEAITLAEGIFVALYELHTGHKSKKELIHNDIKPHNVLVNKYGRVVLIDLGEACGIPPGIKGAFLHPRKISIEPFIVAPEVENEHGSWWQPWKKFACVQRHFSRQSDIYLLASVIDELTEFHPMLGLLAKRMRHNNPELRPSLPLLLISIFSLSGDFSSRFNAFCTEHKNAMPGFSAYMNMDNTQAQAVTAQLLAGIHSDYVPSGRYADYLSGCFLLLANPKTGRCEREACLEFIRFLFSHKEATELELSDEVERYLLKVRLPVNVWSFWQAAKPAQCLIDIDLNVRSREQRPFSYALLPLISTYT